jgi:hypothetical protein
VEEKIKRSEDHVQFFFLHASPVIRCRQQELHAGRFCDQPLADVIERLCGAGHDLCVIVAPLSYFFMDNWLQQYEYRTTISWYIFAASATGTLAVTLLTVSFQAIKAATANPVRSLRSE